LFAAAGLYLLTGSLPRIVARLEDSPGEPYVREAYFTMTIVDLCCLVALAIGGMHLLRLKRRGLVISSIVFVTEIVWFIATGALELALGMSGGRWALLGMSIAGAGGIGGLGTAPQILTAYPVWALVALNLVRSTFPNHALQSK
jgi:hypothetical protein